MFIASNDMPARRRRVEGSRSKGFFFLGGGGGLSSLSNLSIHNLIINTLQYIQYILGT